MTNGRLSTRQFELPGRSPVYATNGMAATSHPLATSTALRVLQEGGNAVDAALAANATLSVVEPQMTGIGGDCFVIVAEPDGSLHGLNGSGRSAAAAEFSYFQERGISSWEGNAAHTVTVPGAVKAWEALADRFGTRSMGDALTDAIGYAENGFVVAPRVAWDWAKSEEMLSKHEGATAQFLRNGVAPLAGDKHKVPNLATTLKAIEEDGAQALYNGPIAQDIAATVGAAGGLLSEADLSNVSADWVELISTSYGGYDIHEIPPNGQGITALILLNLMRELGAGSFDCDSVERAHMEVECGRIAYAVRDAYVADPAEMHAKVANLLSDTYTRDLLKSFDPEKRNDAITLPKLPTSDTIYLTVVDRDLRAVSFINSIYAGFGSGLVTPETGIVLQNRGACFSLQEGHDNAIAGGKRPMHTIIPAMVTKNEKLSHCFGVMGGAYQPMGHAHVLSNMIDHGMDPQEALDHGRIFWDADGELQVEASCPSDMITGLSARGHSVKVAQAPIGGGQIIAVDHENGVLIGGSDARKDGHAAGF